MIQEILERRSIRKYQEKEITREQLEDLLKAAMLAPNSGNRQCWRFIAITNKQVLKDISVFSKQTPMLANAQAAIVILEDVSCSIGAEYCYQDAGLAAENILLEAVSLGLGGVYCALGPSLNKMTRYRDYFNLDNYLLPVCVLALGYPNESRPTPDRYDEKKINWVQ